MGAWIEINKQTNKQIISKNSMRFVNRGVHELESTVRYYARNTKEPDNRWQPLCDHLNQTADLTASFAKVFHAEAYGHPLGIHHDIGKYALPFLYKLQGTNLDDVDHASPGGKEVVERYGESLGRIFAYCIVGHHSGLLDYGTAASTGGTLYSRLHKETNDCSAYKEDANLILPPAPVGLPVKPIPNHNGFTLSFFIRMLYSCLVDADWIDTETFMDNGKKPRGSNVTMQDLDKLLHEKLINLPSPTKPLNQKRKQILDRCLDMADQKPGLYTLTVPTGGGKTYSSLAFALKHAVAHGLRRIIYVIPYTSIIEQNAKVFKEVLGSENVLEHHSNFQFDTDETKKNDLVNEKIRLASENWDINVVVTTNVQFFESLYASKKTRCRKLHNIANSVIIFDEAQMLPTEYLTPSLLAITELVQNYGSTAILCTATQPAIKNLLPANIVTKEIIKDPVQLYNDFKKVRVTNLGKVGDEIVVERLSKLDQVLCIVNTRKHAKFIYNSLIEATDDEEIREGTFYLSTLMCPAHRTNVLNEIRKRLDEKKVCRVISTQLIEAGVDVDFPVVYRSFAGLDSIVQAAGRCNRNGNADDNLTWGDLFIFESTSKQAKLHGYLDRTAKVAKSVLRRYADPISIEAISEYFTLLYCLEGKQIDDDRILLDEKNVLGCFEERYTQLEFDFQTAAKRFQFIDNDMHSIIVPYNDKAKALIADIQAGKKINKQTMRVLGNYVVNIYDQEYETLRDNGVITSLEDGQIKYLNDDRYHSEKTGLCRTPCECVD